MMLVQFVTKAFKHGCICIASDWHRLLRGTVFGIPLPVSLKDRHGGYAALGISQFCFTNFKKKEIKPSLSGKRE